MHGSYTSLVKHWENFLNKIAEITCALYFVKNV